MPGTEVKTVDPESNEDLPRGKTGVIHVRGPQVMVGYLNRPEATAKVLRDGWYNTGDLGLCIQLCDGPADCSYKADNWVCRTDITLKGFGHSICLVPPPG